MPCGTLCGVFLDVWEPVNLEDSHYSGEDSRSLFFPGQARPRHQSSWENPDLNYPLLLASVHIRTPSKEQSWCFLRPRKGMSVAEQVLCNWAGTLTSPVQPHWTLTLSAYLTPNNHGLLSPIPCYSDTTLPVSTPVLESSSAWVCHCPPSPHQNPFRVKSHLLQSLLAPSPSAGM